MRRSTLVGTAFFAIFLVVICSSIECSCTDIKDKQVINPIRFNLISHGAIRITQDSNFTDYGFSGNGTVIAPYIIENYSIVTLNNRGIYVKNTTKFFVIRNCYIDADIIGIEIYETADDTASIINNTCNNNDYTGIQLYASVKAKIISNICQNNNDGIVLYSCPEVTIENNYCTLNDGGIHIDGSDDVEIINNVCINNFEGLRLRSSSQSIVAGNTFSNNQYGIILDSSSSYIAIRGNICNYNLYTGIDLDHSSNIEVTDNQCNGNRVGIRVWVSSDDLIGNNTCNLNNYGISVEDSTGSLLINNTCSSNGNQGLNLVDSSYIDIMDSIFTENIIGIESLNADHCYLVNNLIQGNFLYGVSLGIGSEINTIHHNAFIDNNLDGSSQANDEGSSNIWFDTISSEGNHWSDLHRIKPYAIDGDAESVDPYPLDVNELTPISTTTGSEEPIITTLGIEFFSIVLTVLSISMLYLLKKSKKKLISI